MTSQIATDIRNAAIDGNTDLVKKLLAQGADANSRMTTGVLNTPLHNACSRGHFDVVSVLVEHGADIEATNMDGETPLFLAVKHRFPKIIEYLIEKGADIEVTDNQENNLLHAAASVSHPDLIPIVSLLLKKGVDANAENEDGKKPADLAKHDGLKKAILGK